MYRKTLLAAAVAAGSLMGLGSPAQAVPAIVATDQGVVVRVAPPPPIYEAAPQARAGFIWSPGFYEWRGDRYVWNSGHWVETRPGFAWRPPRWEQRGPDHWVLVGGQWVRHDNLAFYDDRDQRRGLGGPDGDLDGDGIANREDRDLDGDGYRNRDDDFPRDPNRH